MAPTALRVFALEQPQRVVIRNALARDDFVVDVAQIGVLEMKAHSRILILILLVIVISAEGKSERTE
jgi:hypothetical protein